MGNGKTAGDRKKPVSEKARKKKRIWILLAVFAAAVLLMFLIMPGIRYARACDLYKSGNYEKALAAFDRIGEYKKSAALKADCVKRIENEKNEEAYLAAEKLFNEGDYVAAMAAYEELDGYKMSSQMITTCQECINQEKYDSAMCLIESGRYPEAKEILAALDGYGDSDELLDDVRWTIIKKSCPGDVIEFGKYEQDGNTQNGREPIEWLVVTRENGCILVISTLGLDYKPYHSVSGSVTWESSSLRKWLNNVFINTAFTANEREAIPEVIVPADRNPLYSVDSGNDTRDKVFLFSIKEMKRYFGDMYMGCGATEYAIEQNDWSEYPSDSIQQARTSCHFWLRTPGMTQEYASVFDYGSLRESGRDADSTCIAVRPALWIQVIP